MPRNNTTLGSYKLLTWNVRGMGAIQKRHRVHTYLLRCQAHIVFLQESHLTESEAQTTRKKWWGHNYSTNYSAFSRGAAIWTRHGVPFTELERRVDDQGRYILLKGTLDGSPVILGSIYAPNFDQDKFLHWLGTALAGWDTIPWILGGDWNAVLDVDMDRSHPRYMVLMPVSQQIC